MAGRLSGLQGMLVAVYLVTYDLHNPGYNYDEILKEIRSGDWAMLSESSYAISTSETVWQAYERIHAKADESDTMYIVTLTAPWTGRGPKDVNDWMDSHLA